MVLRYIHSKTTSKLRTNIMYHMQTFVASKAMHVVYTGGFKFGDGYGCMHTLCPLPT